MSMNTQQINRRRSDTYCKTRVAARRDGQLPWKATMLLTGALLLSMIFATLASAEVNSDRLAGAAKRFSQAIGTIGERDSTIADRADSLSSASRNLASQGEADFGGTKYRDTFKRVKSLVAEIGKMEMQPVQPVVDAWRDIHSNISAIDQKLATGVGGQQSSGMKNLPGKNHGSATANEPMQISTAKNGPDTGRHVDQVEDLSERVKNSFRSMLQKRPKMANKDWTNRLDGQLSSFDQSANKLRDTYKAGANWKPVLAAMKRQAQRVDRFMQKQSLSGPVSKQWRQLKAHLEQI